MIAPAIDIALRRHPSLFVVMAWWIGLFVVAVGRSPTKVEAALLVVTALVQWIHYKFVMWRWRDRWDRRLPP